MPEFDPDRQSGPMALMWVIGGLLVGIGVAVWVCIEAGFGMGVLGLPIIGLFLGIFAAHYDGRL